MLVLMSLQEQDYATLAGMLFQWRRFSGFVVGDRGGAVKVIAEVLGGKLYSVRLSFYRTILRDGVSMLVLTICDQTLCLMYSRLIQVQFRPLPKARNQTRRNFKNYC